MNTCNFLMLTRYWGIFTVLGLFLVSTDLRQPGVAGSSLTTLITLLAILVPSSFSSNGPTTTPLTTRGSYPGDSVVCGRVQCSFGLIGEV